MPRNPYTEFDTHEALHVTSIIADMFGDFVIDTRCAKRFKDVGRLAHKIGNDLGDLYQLIGQKRFLTEDELAQLGRKKVKRGPSPNV